MVTMRFPSTAPTLVRHDFVGYAIHQHGARGALSLAAAELGAGEVQIVPEDAEECAVGIRIDSPPPAIHNQFSDSGHAPYYGAVCGGAGYCPTLFSLRPLGCHLKRAVHAHYFPVELHLVTRDLALVINAELVAVEFAHHRKSDVVAIHFAL